MAKTIQRFNLNVDDEYLTEKADRKRREKGRRAGKRYRQMDRDSQEIKWAMQFGDQEVW